MSIFIEVADERERAARIRAILYPHMAADILAANARVEGVLCAMYYDEMARNQGYGRPRFASVAEMRAHYDEAPVDDADEEYDPWDD